MHIKNRLVYFCDIKGMKSTGFSTCTFGIQILHIKWSQYHRRHIFKNVLESNFTCLIKVSHSNKLNVDTHQYIEQPLT